MEAQVHVPSDGVRSAAQRAGLQSVHPGTVPALSGSVPRASRHQDEGMFLLSPLLLIHPCLVTDIFLVTRPADHEIP